MEPSDDPHVRLRDILLVQAETVPARDEYLAGLLSEEATRTAVVAMFRERRQPQVLPDVDRHIRERARETGVERQWAEGQDIVRETKDREDESLRAALRRYRRRATEMEE